MRRRIVAAAARLHAALLAHVTMPSRAALIGARMLNGAHALNGPHTLNGARARASTVRPHKALALLAVITAFVVAACDERPRDEKRADSTASASSRVDTSMRVSDTLPSGRFQLPMSLTKAPDLWITLPEGYRIKSDQAAQGDRFFIVSTDDPGLTDPSATTPGFMRIYVGPVQQKPFEGVSIEQGERVLVAGTPLQWRLSQETLPGGGSYLKRDLGSADFFGRFSPELAKAGLRFHVYVAGADPAKVAELMKSAETISIVP